MRWGKLRYNHQSVGLATPLLAIILVLCSSMLIHIVKPAEHGSEMSSVMCCSHGGENSIPIEMNHMTMMSLAGFFSIIPLIAIFSAFSNLLLLIWNAVFALTDRYIQSIRDKYGGFGVLTYLIKLFSSGILHSKIFSFGLVS